MRETDDSRQIAAQNAAYRRGVVLGLTMAEVAILIIFILLLLVGFKEWTEIIQQEANRSNTLVPLTRLGALEEAEKQLNEILSIVDLPSKPTAEEIRALVRVLLETAQSTNGQSALQEARDALKEMQRIKEELAAKGYPKELIDQIERLGFQIANQQGQLARYEQQLRDAGLGKGERPCWVKADGTIEFLFDVVLETNGIRMRENIFPSRAKERASLPIPLTEPTEALSPSEFLTRTTPLYESSLAANCRFFVTVFDGTGAEEKERYKTLLRTVEGHFYKRLSLDPPPF